MEQTSASNATAPLSGLQTAAESSGKANGDDLGTTVLSESKVKNDPGVALESSASIGTNGSSGVGNNEVESSAINDAFDSETNADANSEQIAPDVNLGASATLESNSKSSADGLESSVDAVAHSEFRLRLSTSTQAEVNDEDSVTHASSDASAEGSSMSQSESNSTINTTDGTQASQSSISVGPFDKVLETATAESQTSATTTNFNSAGVESTNNTMSGKITICQPVLSNPRLSFHRIRDKCIGQFHYLCQCK